MGKEGAAVRGRGGSEGQDNRSPAPSPTVSATKFYTKTITETHRRLYSPSGTLTIRVMLRYLGLGNRRFGLYPIKSQPRINWEIFAVVRGRCSPLAVSGKAQPLRSRTLWVFPPGCSHTWSGDRDKRAYIAVFHFGSLPPQLEAEVHARGSLELPLTPAECRRIVALATRLRPDFQEPNTLSNLLFHGAQIELSLLALSKLPNNRKPLPEAQATRTVADALQWYSENIRANPSIEEVAQRVHVSPSTLRRLFKQTRNESPAKVFAHLRLEAALHLMTETRLKLDAIAAECGFGSTSDFCRAFKAFTKVTPSVWRKTIIPPPKCAFLS
jgi:AraC family transcriptional regulator